MKSFVKEVMARLKGDDDKVVAERNFRKANAAVRGQISSLESKKVDLEVKLDEASDELLAAKYPTSPIQDASQYVRTIAAKQSNVDRATEELEEVEESLDYFENLSAEFNK